LVSTVSLKALEYPEIPSSRHCQEDQVAYVYNLVANINEVGKRQRDDEDANENENEEQLTKRQRRGGFTRRTNKRRTNKRRTNKRRTNKRRTNKRRTNKRRTNKRRL
jgi:hypothetical protein